MKENQQFPERKYPRYFILAEPKYAERFLGWKEILYCRVDAPKGKYFHVLKDGSERNGFNSNSDNGELICDKTVGAGYWREVTEEELPFL